MSQPELLLSAQGLTYGGEFDCSSEQGGESFRVRGVVPGERFAASPLGSHDHTRRAELGRLIESSPDRIAPACPYFGVCGGCDLQHIGLVAQRQIKLRLIESTLVAHELRCEGAAQLHGAELPGFGYKRRIALHINKEGQIGFTRRGKRWIVDIQQCALATPAINEALTRIRPYGPQIAPAFFEIFIEEFEGKAHIALIIPPHKRFVGIDFRPSLDPLRSVFPDLRVIFRNQVLYLQHNFREVELENGQQPPVSHFSQGNAAGNALLVERVLNLTPPGSEVMDLYAGAGNFGLPLARRGERVTLVEMDGRLLDYARGVAAREGFSDRVQFVEQGCEKFARHGSFSPVVILDPPRYGAEAVAQAVSPSSTKRIIYVSCHLPSQCRDMRIMCDRGFELRSLELIDMYPQTHHTETVAVLEPKGATDRC